MPRLVAGFSKMGSLLIRTILSDCQCDMEYCHVSMHGSHDKDTGRIFICYMDLCKQ